ncbi:MAG: hypothetical protein A3K19_13440 [Lentisphaerae bacterium RIFOXYB12_FULL_65_16]|nr:MAG: hypothetical protein A3K18_28960 [Lentisphaerae bacterium RIFOXYA12_64_32]OGV86297.1 MAG: hypothetical protein A3K19_13440 [Lentisphaerae bacterium RIFOXYB12_FULL_65_16]
MKKAGMVAGLVLMGLALGSVAGAQSGDGREADHEALRALRGKVTAAIEKQDMKALVECMASKFVVITVDQSRLTSETELTSYFDNMFRAKDSKVSGMTVAITADALTQFTDANTGYCTGTSKDTYTLKRGGTATFDSRWTAVLVKEKGAWKVAAVHCGVNFLDNPLYSVKKDGFWRRLGRAFGIGT